MSKNLDFNLQLIVLSLKTIVIFKGNKAPGRMGRDTVTVQNIVLVKVIADRNLLLVKGAVPGKKGGLLKVKGAVKGQNK